MRPVTILFVLCFVTIAVVGGCSAIESDKKYCIERGILKARIYAPADEQCKIDYYYRNLAKHVQKPLIDIIAYDDKGKIVAQDKLSFPEIKPGGTHSMSRVVQCTQNIFRIFVRDAVDKNRCYGYDCSVLCDIKDKTIETSK